MKKKKTDPHHPPAPLRMKVNKKSVVFFLYNRLGPVDEFDDVEACIGDPIYGDNVQRLVVVRS